MRIAIINGSPVRKGNTDILSDNFKYGLTINIIRFLYGIQSFFRYKAHIKYYYCYYAHPY